MQIASRDNFGDLLNSLNLTGRAAEIGVGYGHFSWELLRTWKGDRLYSIDPYQHQEGVQMDASNVSQKEHDEIFALAKKTLKEYKNRSVIICDFSVRASTIFQNETFDFVYIDARHDYRSVNADLNAWYPKVKEGGIIAGHDYKNSFVRNNLVEVQRAVDNFFLQKEKVYVTTEDNLPSWHVIKS